ncbi:hypothetical protein [Hyphomonas sp. UBA4494]|uniref:hypothetical protein n=1 Tax=Hyphomonas sp. UBA4494 TaxID=1946631 RepID=UPI0025BEA127|nr:hypothetical protein [Hyphomonas sp. UBA4494]
MSGDARLRRCLVLGSAACLWADIEAALSVGEYDAVIAAKQAGIVWPGELYGWVSLHPDWMMDYRKQRRDHGYPEPCEVVANQMMPGIDRAIEYKWPGQTRSGASGGVAIKYAIDEGFERIVACGIPMSAEIGRIDGRPRWTSASTYQGPFRAALPFMKDKVRSVSGWTRKELGAPTPEWLNS